MIRRARTILGAALVVCLALAGGSMAQQASEPTVVLGRPTDRSIALGILPNFAGEAVVDYGTVSGQYPNVSATVALASAKPGEIELTSLQPDTRYFYRLRTRSDRQADWRAGPEHTFVTARAPGQTFTFAVQGDSHPERANQMFNAALYTTNLRNAAGERPDFYIGLGDDFSVEHLLDTNTQSQDAINQLYATQRG